MRDRRFLFATFMLLYALTASGDLVGESEIRWGMAQRLVYTGRLEPGPDAPGSWGRDRQGQAYTAAGVVPALLLVPAVVVGELAGELTGAPRHGVRAGQLIASLIIYPAAGALATVLLYGLALGATANARAARWIAVAGGAGTMLWHETAATDASCLVALGALGTLWAIERAWRRDRLADRVLAAAVAGITVLVSAPSLVMTGPLLAAGALADPGGRARRLGKWGLAVALGLVPGLLAFAALNAARFGEVLPAGALDPVGVFAWEPDGAGLVRLEHAAPAGPAWGGRVAALLASPGLGLLVFNPILLAAAIGAPRLWREQRAMALALAAALLGALAYQASCINWTGGPAWGPRALAPLAGACLLALGPALARRPAAARGARALAALLAISVAVQIGSIVYRANAEAPPEAGATPWSVAESPIARRAATVARHLAGDPGAPDEHRPVVNVFPFKARAIMGPGAVAGGLLALWLLGVLALDVTRRRWRSDVEECPDA